MENRFSDKQFEIVEAAREHVPGMASCYMAAFPTALIVILGDYFLRGLCKTFVKSSKGFGLVAVDKQSGAVVGMIIGGDPRLRGRYLLTRTLHIVAVAAWKSATSTSARHRLWHHAVDLAVRYRILTPRRYSRAPTAPKTGLGILQALAVRPEYRRRGIARGLTEMFVAQCAARGYSKIRLTTESDNTPAIKLYTSCGWKLIGGRGEMRYFSLQINSQARKEA